MTVLTAIHMNKKMLPGFFSRLFMMCVLLVFTLPAGSDEAKAKVALVAASGSDIEVISLRDVRRLYLGIKSGENKSVRNPVLNLQSTELYDEFLKNIMHMTVGSYKRKLVKSIFRQGREEIQEIASINELNKHLLENKGDISFVELTAIENMENIEVVQILW
jgi:hypothetical protein